MCESLTRKLKFLSINGDTMSSATITVLWTRVKMPALLDLTLGARCCTCRLMEYPRLVVQTSAGKISQVTLQPDESAKLGMLRAKPSASCSMKLRRQSLIL